jgi:hypothetical protein
MALQTSRGTQALLDLEDDAPEVLFETLAGAAAPLWPDIRSAMWNAMFAYDFGPSGFVPPPAPGVHPLIRLAGAMRPSRWDARTLRSRRRALYLVSGVTTFRADGREHNSLVGDFAERFRDASAILQWRPMTAPPAFSPTRSLDPLVTRAAAMTRLSRRSVDGAAVHRIVGDIAHRLDTRITDRQIDDIAATAVYAASLEPQFLGAVSRILDRVSPQVVLMEDASYGGWAGLVAVLKSRGIAVVEPQHGWIGPSHGAYNFGAAMRAPELAATLPDELLTFGDFWADGIRHPAPVTAIGRPHLERMAQRAWPVRDRSRDILVVSSVTDAMQMTDVVLALRAALPAEWTIRFRAHPSERAQAGSTYGRMLAAPGVELDGISDVYDSLSRARGVVGVTSTVLFEAVALGCRVFALDTVFTDYYVGNVFGPRVQGPDDVHRIVDGVGDDSRAPAGVARDALWKPHPMDNFAAWGSARFGW